jgi:Tol biopolymer transport system component
VRRLAAAIAAFAVAAGCALGGVSAADAADACPNAGIRAQQHVEGLPDCLAYEKVSPADKGGGDVPTFGTGSQYGTTFASPDGDRMIAQSYAAFSGAPTGDLNQYLFTRGPSGWTTSAVTPSHGDATNFPDFATGFKTFSCPSCGEAVGVFPSAPDPADTNEANDVYTTTGSGHWTWISRGALPNTTGADYRGSSADGHVIGFSSTSVLEPAASGTTAGAAIAYTRERGTTHVVGLDNDGSLVSAGGSAIGDPTTAAVSKSAISRDGRRIVFTSPVDGSSPSHLYVRQDNASTIRVDAPQCVVTTDCNESSPGGSQFAGATSDGGKVFFMTANGLVDGDTDLPNSPNDLYELDLHDQRLSRVARNVGYATVPGLIGLSDDGAYLYVTSGDVLAGNANGHGDHAQAADINLYVIHRDGSGADQTTYIGRFGGGGGESVYVSPSGRFMVTSNAADLTASSEGGTTQLYLFDAQTAGTTCLSCGRVPDSPADQSLDLGSLAYGPTDDGQVLYTTPNVLTPHDDNGWPDVFVWKGGAGGQPYQLTSGHSAAASVAEGMSADGQTLFFSTLDRLVAADADTNTDVYAARVGGGFPEPPAPAPDCVGPECQGPVSPPVALASIGSLVFGPVADGRSPGARPDSAARVRVTTPKGLRGSSFTLRVTVAGPGRLRVAGHDVATVDKKVAKRGTYAVTVRLTKKAKAILGRKHKLTVRVRATFTPAKGKPSGTTMSITTRSK